MNWRDYISTTKIAPNAKGLALSTSFILQLLAAGWTTDQILQNYPQLRPEHLRAVFAFAAEFLTEDYYLKL
jgi:uncharacterized protein (DUF433 family)